MKILTTAQLREADALTIEREPIASIDLMERAASARTDWIVHRVKGEVDGFSDQTFQIFCGIGNNGGDGLALARLLTQHGYRVEVWVCRYSEKTSDDFAANAKRLEELQIPLGEIKVEADVPKIISNGVVIDAIFGSGLSRPIEGLAAEVVRAINQSPAVTIAIDLPSGLFGEDNRENNRKTIVQAKYTLTFERPKLAMMFPDNAPFIGHWQVLPIGLDLQFIAEAFTRRFYLTAPMLKSVLRPRAIFAHKGTYGHVGLLVGSLGKIGAVTLSAKAALRSGAGLVSVHCPKIGYSVVQTAVPEAMVEADFDMHQLTELPSTFHDKNWGIGPGIGTSDETALVVKKVVQESGTPVVFDADALNILAKNPTWLQFLPPRSILTPHPGEFRRLVGDTDAEFGRLEALIKFAKKHRAYVVLKGAHTTIAGPDGEVFFNSTGNPGMASGGMGDALTGLITGLLAQGYSSKEACLLGVFLHGLAADIAAENNGWEALTASDVIDHFGQAFQRLWKA